MEYILYTLNCQEGLAECNMVPRPDSEIQLGNWKKKCFNEETAN